MNSPLTLQRSLVIFGVPLLLIALMVFLAKSPLFSANQEHLSIGITFDLLLTTPLVYFALIRKTKIPKITVVPVLIICMVVATAILPDQNQYYLGLFKTWIFPVVELTVISFIIYKVNRVVSHYKKHKVASEDFYSALKKTCAEMLPKFAVAPVSTEVAVFYYGFFRWKKKRPAENEFTYHKESASISLLVAVIFIVAVETIVLHILLAKWSEIAAWIVSFLSIYTGLQIFGFLKSMLVRPFVLENTTLSLRYGIVNETAIDLHNIETVEITSKDLELDADTRKLSFLGALESHNVVIRLKEPETLFGLYGMRRMYQNLAIHVDEPSRFASEIMHRINKDQPNS